jgi:hypothetical protein
MKHRASGWLGRAVWWGQAAWQNLGYGVDEAARCGDGCCRLVGGDRHGGWANAVICRGLVYLAAPDKKM